LSFISVTDTRSILNSATNLDRECCSQVNRWESKIQPGPTCSIYRNPCTQQFCLALSDIYRCLPISRRPGRWLTGDFNIYNSNQMTCH